MDKPKVTRKGVDEMNKIIESGNDPLSKEIRKLKKDTQKTIMREFSVEGGKKDVDDN